MTQYLDGPVAIIGAGIGGLTAALSLQHFGVPVRVFEQARALRVGGSHERASECGAASQRGRRSQAQPSCIRFGSLRDARRGPARTRVSGVS